MSTGLRPALRFSIGLAVVAAALWWLAPKALHHLYPLHYAELARTYAKAYEVDPLLVVAVMRVESNFDLEARSSKGARGLMQLMPETANWAAEQLGMKLDDPARLAEPEVNIELGTWYLSTLIRNFKGDLPLALAAYNGGQTNVERWLEQRDWSGERETVDDIPFPETRRYVRKVLFTYDWYRRLYGDRFPEPALDGRLGPDAT